MAGRNKDVFQKKRVQNLCEYQKATPAIKIADRRETGFHVVDEATSPLESVKRMGLVTSSTTASTFAGIVSRYPIVHAVSPVSLPPPVPILMPATFESLGLTFLYPDNWVIAERAAEDGIDGATLELPSGGFFSLERVDRLGPDRVPTAEDDVREETLIASIEKLIVDEYGKVEREEWPEQKLEQADRVVDLNFYYLDLLIISRLIFIGLADGKFVIQIQAESRSFEENELVFAAIMKQLQDG